MVRLWQMAAQSPILLLDVDGVLNPYPDLPPGFEEHFLFPADREPVRLAPHHRPWLHELLESFQIVWATGWGVDANRLLGPVFGLPELPHVALPHDRFNPREKVTAIDAMVGDRSAAWVDDLVTPEARRWASARSHPTILIEVNPLRHRLREAGRPRGSALSSAATRLAQRSGASPGASSTASSI
jgi:hypothetical protein